MRWPESSADRLLTELKHFARSNIFFVGLRVQKQTMLHVVGIRDGFVHDGLASAGIPIDEYDRLNHFHPQSVWVPSSEIIQKINTSKKIIT